MGRVREKGRSQGVGEDGVQAKGAELREGGRMSGSNSVDNT